jgi:hypothetical protein
MKRARGPLKSLVLLATPIVFLLVVAPLAHAAQPTPVGACCWPDSCRIVTQEACAQEHGLWMGGSTPCTPNPCPQCRLLPCSGACCFPDGHCELIYQGPCQASNGIFFNWQLCSPNPCDLSSAPMPSQFMPGLTAQSWGKIKSIYR